MKGVFRAAWPAMRLQGCREGALAELQANYAEIALENPSVGSESCSMLLTGISGSPDGKAAASRICCAEIFGPDHDEQDFRRSAC